jgi:molecular chaperone GrpE
MAQDDATAPHSSPETAAAEEIQGQTCAVAEHAQLAGLLEDARSKADEHWNQVLRANAELDNTRKRARQDVENAHKYGVERFAQALLPVRDSLEMGLAAAQQAGGDTATSLKQGVELTLKMFDSALEKFSVRVLNPLGEPFNPAQHQAMTLQESAAHAPDTVIAVMQKGYLLHDRLLRPAMVVVSKAPAETQQIDAKA